MSNQPQLALAEKVASRLTTKGAHSVVVVGSIARDDHHKYSDVDIIALGAGPHHTLEVIDGCLVSISWRVPAAVRDSFDDPFVAGAAVPSWRGAVLIRDPNGVAASVQHAAHSWQWESIHTQCERAVAHEITEYAEEIYRIVGLRRAGRRRAAAGVRSAMLFPLCRAMAVHHRLMYDSENALWDLVGAAMGHDWIRDFDIAAGVERGAADLAVLSLYRLAAHRVDRTLSVAQRLVVASAVACTEDAV